MDRSTLHSFSFPRTSLHKWLGRLKAKKKKSKFQFSPTGRENNMSNSNNNNNIIFTDPLTDTPTATGRRPGAGQQLSLAEALESISPSRGRTALPDPFVGGGPVLAPMLTRGPTREYITGDRPGHNSGPMPFPIPERSSSRGPDYERRDSSGRFASYRTLDHTSTTTSRPVLGELGPDTQPSTRQQRMPTGYDNDLPYSRPGHNRRHAMAVYPSDYNGFDIRHARRHPSVTGDPTLPHYRSASAYARDPGGLPPAYDEVFDGGGARTTSQGESMQRPPRYSSFDAGRGAAPVPIQYPATRGDDSYGEGSGQQRRRRSGWGEVEKWERGY
ncbi:hypothetical protein BST61_g7391 [Cercospora zeina]